MINMKEKELEAQMFEEQLFRAKQALFKARSVREVKFLQNKINYLMKKLKKKS